ncbi:FCD domain-containing protein [Microbacterium esteraromaticum]|jgi:DNA-binding FadR family transcriptional regulator|uniref:FadR/GntR family transcriptional regulator n=1 Tax=Microbacterium TaxID=33882 RepID=UPI0030B2AFC7
MQIPLTPPHVPLAVSGDLRNMVLDTLGREICSGAIGPDSTFTTESVEDRFQVSRPVVREALRALEALGLVVSKRRVGVRVQPLTQWNVYDLQVIRWRLAGPSRVAQLRSLTELRGAIEPAAARLAAMRAPLNQASELVGLAGRLWAAGREGDTERFLQLDREFHALVLEMSGNEMFAQLHHLVDEVLSGRTHYGLMPQYPAHEALQMHVDIATAIQAGNADKAAAAMIAIMERTMNEMRSIWEQQSAEL